MSIEQAVDPVPARRKRALWLSALQAFGLALVLLVITAVLVSVPSLVEQHKAQRCVLDGRTEFQENVESADRTVVVEGLVADWNKLAERASDGDEFLALIGRSRTSTAADFCESVDRLLVSSREASS